MVEQIRSVLAGNAKLAADASQIDPSDDLYLLGMTSHATVSVMLALEEEFGLEFPSAMLSKSTFSSIDSIRRALEELGALSDT